MKDFLERFFYNNGLMAVFVGSIHNVDYYEGPPEDIPSNTDVYFSPAMRSAKGNIKGNVLGTRFLWVDADDPAKPLCTLPPTMRVFSGHGWHLYWALDEPVEDVELIERLNQILAKDVPTGDDSCWNANRILRVPGTINTKGELATVELKEVSPHRYTTSDILVIEKLDRKTRHKVRTGDSRGYRSRSERDWAVIVKLVAAGASDGLIETIFAGQPIGVKYHEENGPKYLKRSIEKARASGAVAAETGGFTVGDDGYYRATSRGAKRVSTFTFDPNVLLDGSLFGAEDAIVGDVAASGYRWTGVTFTRQAFTTLARLDRETPVAAWQWLGRDDDIRALLPYLLNQLQEKGLPRVAATPVLGLHKLKDHYFFLGTDRVVSASDEWDGFEGPLAWLPSKKEHPDMPLLTQCSQAEVKTVRDSVPKLNEPGPLWAMLGWYAASPLKPWFEEHGYRFPMLNVVGTKGSGKTTLIQRVFMPLFGQRDPKSYDAGTTRFVVLALLGSSNAVPIAFSEFRFDAVERFVRFILLAYDTGHDPRGRGDQTTVDYPLSAPFTIDGEDLVDDPAARERVVVSHLHPATIAEGSEAFKAFEEFRWLIPEGFGGYYIKQLLLMIEDGTAERLLQEASNEVHKAFPSRLPDRVRRNHVVCYAGVKFFGHVTSMTPPGASVLSTSIGSVFDLETGRARTMADSMVEDIVNAGSQGTQSYRWYYDDKQNVFWFQLSSTHTWWLASRRRAGRGALERDAIKSQLKEADYILGPQAVRNTWMYGVRLDVAQRLGLDIPSKLNVKQVTFNLAGG